MLQTQIIGILKNIKIEFILLDKCILAIKFNTDMENIIINFNNLNLNQKSFNDLVLEKI